MAATQTAPRTLTAAELSAYLRDGFLVVRDVVPLDTLATLDRDIEADWQRKSRDPRLSVEEVNNSHFLGRDNEHAKTLARDARMLALIEGLVFPGIRLFSAKVISKAPSDRRMVCHWHQDEAYWHQAWPSERRLSLWIPLADVDRENGCLRVVPGSHRGPLLPHDPRTARDHGACRLSFADGSAELPDAVDVPISAGSLIIFSSMLQHSSLGNARPSHRRAFILTYQDAAGRSKDAEGIEVLRPA
jgi:hypothetical protein